MKKTLIVIITIIIASPFVLFSSYLLYKKTKNIPGQRDVSEFQKQNCLKKHPYKFIDGTSHCNTTEELKNKYPTYLEKKFCIYKTEHLKPNHTKYKDILQKEGKLKTLIYRYFPFTIPATDPPSYTFYAIENLDSNFVASTTSYKSDYKQSCSMTYLRSDDSYAKKPRSPLEDIMLNSKSSRLHSSAHRQSVSWPITLNWPAQFTRQKEFHKGDDFNQTEYYEKLVEINGEPGFLYIMDSAVPNDFTTKMEACWGNCRKNHYGSTYSLSCNKNCMHFAYSNNELEKDIEEDTTHIINISIK